MTAEVIGGLSMGTNQPESVLEAFADGTMDYAEFAGRVRRRSRGAYEDGDWDPPDEYD